MKKAIILALIILAGVGGFALFSKKSGEPVNSLVNPVGFDREGSGFTTSQFSTRASASQQGLVKNVPGRVFALEVTSDATALRYFQLFDMVKPSTVPARAASQSSNYNIWAYGASQSFDAKPVGSYKVYASASLVYSVPIPAATASSSPSVVRIGTDWFSPARKFSNGIIWAISSQFATYASSSVTTGRHQVKVIYE